MTYRERDRVGGVVRSRRSREIAYSPHHVHHLCFFRSAIADHGLLDLKRRVFVYPDPGLAACKEYHSPAVRNGNAGSDIGVEKKLLNGHRVRLEGIEQFEHVVVYLLEPA